MKKRIWAFEAYEVTVHAIKMEAKMHLALFLVCLFLHGIYLSWYLLDSLQLPEFYGLRNLVFLRLSELVNLLGFRPQIEVPFWDFEHQRLLHIPFDLLPYRIGLIHASQVEVAALWGRLSGFFWLSSLVYLIWPLGWVYYGRKAVAQRKEQFIRGTLELEARTLVKATVKGELPLGPAKMPVENEVLHTLVVGAIGMGKTVLLSGILEGMIKRGDPAVVHDFKGDFTAKYYDPKTDVIFNPCDVRGVSWNLFEEVDQSSIEAAKLDVENIVTILIPEPPGNVDPIWTMAPRDVLRGILLGLIEKRRTTNQDVFAVISSHNGEIKTFLESTHLGKPGAAHIETGSKSLFTQSVLSILRAHTSFFQYMDDRGERFSIRAWLESGQGRIFLLNSPQTQEALKPILTLFLDLLGRRLLSLPESRTRRVCFLLDELGQLKKSGSLQNLITLGRSKGAAVFMGIQDLGQLDQIYGKNGRIGIVNSAGNAAVFGLNDPETARFLSEKLGKKEVLEVSDSVSMGAAEVRDGKTLSWQRKELFLYRPEELLGLPQLQTIVSLRNFGPARLSLTHQPRPDVNRPFVMKPGLSFESVRELERRAQNPKEPTPSKEPAPEPEPGTLFS